MLDLRKLLLLLPVVGPVLARSPDFVAWWVNVSTALNPADQATAKAALADVQADNDAGHARLQAKLATAARRT